MDRNWQAATIVLGLALVLPLLSASAAFAQFGMSDAYELSSTVEVREPEGAARTHLERIKALLADEQWDEAVETLQQLMESEGDRLLAIERQPLPRYLSVRDYCHLQIAQLAPPALELYRDRVDPLAGQWYDEGVAGRDAAQLERVVERFFCSAWGDDALLKLGELAIERGDYGQARAHLARISPQLRWRDGRPLWLVSEARERYRQGELAQLAKQLAQQSAEDWLAYPDSKLDLADVRARLVLVSILEGSTARAEFELALFQHLHPEAQATWAGRELRLVEQLQRLLAAAQDVPPPQPADAWPTFAGSPRRSARLAPAARPVSLAWREPIELGEPLRESGFHAHDLGYGGRRPTEDRDALLSYHPLVVDGLLLVNSLTEIRAFDLETGEPAWGQQRGVIYQDKQLAPSSSRSSLRKLGVPRFTMTAKNGRLFARMGEPVTSRPGEATQMWQPDTLVCLDLHAQGQLLWKATARRGDTTDDESWAFEGAPLSDGNHVYIALRRSDVRPQAYVACYDAQNGRELWRQFVCAAETPARGQAEEITSNLLTLAEETLYYNTNLGAVAALATADGHIHWLSQYERQTKGDLSQPPNHFYRDLNPCLYHQGIVVAAPADSRAITAFDSATGQRLWATAEPAEAVHLLGVRGRYLLASGERLWWIELATGRVMRRWPDGGSGGPRGYGRGILAGEEIFWPTRERIYIFNAETGTLSQEPIQLAALGAPAGNLLALGNHFLIASASHLYGFRPAPRPAPPAERGVTGSATPRAIASLPRPPGHRTLSIDAPSARTP